MDDRVTGPLDDCTAPNKVRHRKVRSWLAFSALILVAAAGYGVLFWVFDIWSGG